MEYGDASSIILDKPTTSGSFGKTQYTVFDKVYLNSFTTSKSEPITELP